MVANWCAAAMPTGIGCTCPVLAQIDYIAEYIDYKTSAQAHALTKGGGDILSITLTVCVGNA